MNKEDFKEKLEEIRKGSELTEIAFPGKFTDFEKATIVMNIVTQTRLDEISSALMDDMGECITDRLWQLAEAVEKL